MTKEKTMTPKKKAGIAAMALAGMTAIATPLLIEWEGVRTDPYRDSVGIQTVCVGETRVEMRRYTLEECKALLGKAIPEFALPVAEAAPGIEYSPYEWAAHTSLAYNIGVNAYRKSSVARLFNEGKRVEACEFFARYNRAGGRVLKGLDFRRNGDAQRIGEIEVCLIGATQAEQGS
mgnify:FL=1